MKKILLALLLSPICLFAQEKPFGTYISDVKSFYYGNWQVKKNDTIKLRNDSIAIVVKITKYSQDDVEGYVYYTKLKIGDKNDTYNFDEEVENGNIIMPEGIEKNKYQNTNSTDSYTAANGKTYRVGDVVKMGRGSGANGDFIFLTMGGYGAILTYDSRKPSGQLNISAGYAGLGVNIKKIKRYKFKGISKVYFVVGGGNITNYLLDIEQAIATCEVEDCTPKNSGQIVQQLSPADEILKFKSLLDQGIITQEEFDKKKQELLNK